MQDQILIVSNPPQGEIDFPVAAPCFGLSPAEVRMKANYGVPEIWVADPDASKIEKTAQTMRLAGLSLVVLSGEDLLLPPQRAVTSFSFGAKDLAVRFDDEELAIPYHAPLIAVLCQPRRSAGENAGHVKSSGMTDGLVQHRGGVFMTRDSLVGFGGLGRRSSSIGGESGEDTSAPAAFVDLYDTSSGEVTRLSVMQAGTDFAGLGRLATERPAEQLAAFLQTCEEAFPNGRFDRRLVDMVPRVRPMVGTKTRFDLVRKGYSFATEALSNLLSGIAPGLEDVSQFELASRLAYLTGREYKRAESMAA